MIMKHESGVSLVELMIGLTIGVLMLLVLSSLLVNSSQARKELDKTTQQMENGRYAMDLLVNELRHAGYYGEGETVGLAPAALPDPCATDVASLKVAMPVPVQGYARPTASPLTCLADANLYAGAAGNTDILVVRRVSTVAVSPAALDPATSYLQTIGNQYVLDLGANSAVFNLATKSGAPAPIYPVNTQIYFVSPCSRPASGAACTGAADDNGSPIPTLKRLELTSTGWQLTPLVEGIERLHFEYGVDSDGDGTPDSYTSSPAGVADWANVVGIQVGLLARNTQQTIGYADTKSYRLGTLAIAAANDTFKRHAYNQAVRLANVDGKRMR
jgi:type IV pilus assembly protein PilW